ncbi:mu-type opioid receptor-like [Ptychodera flava]|uniref:mu-type opioid receptor-like n=1 Tax=Ptychodera flava TaxID=63121 RepID=UPI00396A22B1
MTAIASALLDAYERENSQEQMDEDCVVCFPPQINSSDGPAGNWTYDFIPFQTCMINFYFMLTLIVVFAVSGFVENGVFIFVVIRVKSMRTLPNYFMINLACADVLCLASLCVYPLINALGAGDNVYLVQLRVFLADISTFTSITTVMLITVDRYIAICRPLHAPRIQRKSRAHLLVALSWAVGIALGLLEYICASFRAFHGKTATTIILMTFLSYTSLVMAVVLLLYILIITRLLCRPNTVRRLPFRRKREYRNETKVLVMCSVVAILFLVCFGPQIIILFLAPIAVLQNTFPSPLFLSCVTTVSPLMVMVNFALNPLLYNAPSYRHRLAFKKAFMNTTYRNNGDVELNVVTSARTINSSNFSEARQMSRQ